MGTTFLCVASVAVALSLAGCGNLERENPLDPGLADFVPIMDLIVGTWSLDDGETNQVYFLEASGRIELRDYSSPNGGAVDRNGSYPDVLVIGFVGTYTVSGNFLRARFTESFWNNTAGQPPSPPLETRVLEFRLQGKELFLKDAAGERAYVSH